jgi:MFS family permease
LSTQQAALVLAMVGAASLCGRMILGFAADFVGRLNMLKASTVALTAASMAWPFAESLPSIMAVALVYGFFSGAVPSLPPTILADYYEKAFPKQLLKLVAVCVQAQVVGAMLG